MPDHNNRHSLNPHNYPDPPPEPPNMRPDPWDLRVSAAYLRLIGLSQTDAAQAVDRSPRCLRQWENHPSWPDAKHEATVRWLSHATNQARVTVTRGIMQGDLPTARWLLERVDPLFIQESAKQPNHFNQQNNQHNHIHIGDNGNGPNGNGDNSEPEQTPLERGAAILQILLEATGGQAGAFTDAGAEADEVHPLRPVAKTSRVLAS